MKGFVMKMKLICLCLLFVVTAFALSACATGYEDVQQKEQMMQRPNCTGLHVGHASWRYTDANGYPVSVQGKCVKGMKHGRFIYYLGGKKVAVSSFHQDVERKTTCLAQGKKSRTVLEKCLEEQSEFYANQKQTAP